MPFAAKARNAVVLGRRAAGRARRLALRRASAPTLSVVVPIYNVEAYVEECLDSLRAQTWTNLQVIMVDDGSTDSSPELAARYAATDSRFTLVRRPNGGLGAARNTGLAQVKGKYLTFVDSDDIIPPRAYEAMIGSAETSGADLVVGKIMRLRKGERAPLAWSEDVHDHQRSGIAVADHPRILRDFYSPNKLYRTSFWREHGFSFREGVLFEDQPLITEIYCRARTVDVLRGATYLWRQRGDRSSISDNLRTVPHIRARMDAIALTREVIDRLAPELAPAWHWTLVDNHFPDYLVNSAPRDPEVLDEAVAMIRGLLSPEDVLRTPWVSPQSRVLCYLAARYGSEAVRAFLQEKGYTWRFPVETKGKRILARLPLRDDPRWPVPEEAFEVGDRQCRLNRWVNDAGFGADGSVEVVGRAYLEYVDTATSEPTIEVLCARGDPDDSGSMVTPFPTSPIGPENFVGPPPSHPQLDYPGSDFSCSIDLDQLVATVPPDDAEANWDLYVRVSVNGRSRTAALDTNAARATAGNRSVRQIDDERLAAVLLPARGLGLRIRVWRPDVLVTHLDGDATGVSFSARCTAGLRPRWRLLDQDGAVLGSRVRTGASDGAIALRVDDPPAGEWRLAAEGADGSPLEVAVPPDVRDALSATPWEARPIHTADLLLRTPRRSAVIDDLEIEDAGLRVTGTAASLGVDSVRGHLHSPKARADGVVGEVTGSDARFSILLPYDHTAWGVAHHGVLPMTEYRPVLEDAVTGAPIPWVLRDDVRLSRVHTTETMTLSLLRTADRQALVRVRRPKTDREAERRARDRWKAADRPLRDAVLFQCLRGEVAADSQAAIHAELHERFPELPLMWSVTDHAVTVPPGGQRLVRGTPEWYDAWSSCRWICVNHELPSGFTKAKGQVVIQTYHGHPYKLMGIARWRFNGLPQGLIDEALARSQWDYLLAPSPDAARMYADQFPTAAQLLQVGYPRNDPLTAPTASERRELTRRMLGIEEEETAVLYAPTWRDYATTDPWRSKMVEFLDPVAFSDALGPGFKLLVRGHPAHQRHRSRLDLAPRLVEVTDHPDVNDLILASDVGVFDYSSIRFDYSVTGKPMLFFVPDEKVYLDSVGGLLPFEETTPGPRVHDEEDLLKALHDLPGMVATFAEEYAAFRTRFNPWEDGHASARLVDQVFAPHLDESGRS